MLVPIALQVEKVDFNCIHKLSYSLSNVPLREAFRCFSIRNRFSFSANEEVFRLGWRFGYLSLSKVILTRMSIVSLGRASLLPMCEPSKQRFNASQRKQNLVVQRRKSYLSGKDQDQYFSIEELLNRIPFQCMVNPYITRLVNINELSFAAHWKKAYFKT